jgi:hypothetical protein
VGRWVNAEQKSNSESDERSTPLTAKRRKADADAVDGHNSGSDQASNLSTHLRLLLAASVSSTFG